MVHSQRKRGSDNLDYQCLSKCNVSSDRIACIATSFFDRLPAPHSFSPLLSPPSSLDTASVYSDSSANVSSFPEFSEQGTERPSESFSPVGSTSSTSSKDSKQSSSGMSLAKLRVDKNPRTRATDE